MRGDLQKALLKHQVSDRHANESTPELRADINRHFRPTDSALRRIRYRDSRVEMRSGDRSEREDERDEGGTGRDGVREQCHRYVSRCQSVAHDPGPDDGSQQHRCADCLGGASLRETRRGHEFCDSSGAAVVVPIPQCAVIGWPGHTGRTSFAALSQTVNTKCSGGASGQADHILI
jgi:hypothetical protein